MISISLSWMGEFLQVYAGFHPFDGFECFEQCLKKVPIQVGVRMSSCATF